MDEGREHERHQHDHGRRDREYEHQGQGAGFRADPPVRHGDEREDHQGDRTADRGDRSQDRSPSASTWLAIAAVMSSPAGGSAADPPTQNRRELAGWPPSARSGPPRDTGPRSVRAGGGEQGGHRHQPVARLTEAGLGCYGQRGSAERSPAPRRACRTRRARSRRR